METKRDWGIISIESNPMRVRLFFFIFIFRLEQEKSITKYLVMKFWCKNKTYSKKLWGQNNSMVKTSPPSARVAAMSDMQKKLSKREQP